MRAAIPVACSLTDKERRARRKNHLDQAAESINDSAELSDGFVFRFPLREIETLFRPEPILSFEDDQNLQSEPHIFARFRRFRMPERRRSGAGQYEGFK